MGAGKRILLVGIALLWFGIFLSLGIWQVERRTWKLALIEAAATRAHAAPVPAPPPSGQGFDANAQVYRHVAVSGRLLTDRSGFWLMTPLEERRGFVVLVNRGFVPARSDAPADAPADAAISSKDVTITGLVRASEPGGGFLRPNRPAEDLWYSRDVAGIAKAKGLSGGAPYFIDADAAPGARAWPRGGLTVLRFPNNHAAYAITWFVLAGMTLVFMVRVLRISERREEEKRGEAGQDENRR